MTVTGDQFVRQVRHYLGKPYQYGAAGPNSFDCSGLIKYALARIGIQSPRTSEQMFTWVKKVDTPQPGDLVFFVGAELDPPPGHVGIVTGPGRMIDAPFTGTVVRYDRFSENGIGVNKLMGYGRIPSITPGKAKAGKGGTARTPNQNAAAAAVSGLVVWIVVVVLAAAAITGLVAAAVVFK